MEKEYEFNGKKYIIFKGNDDLFDYDLFCSMITDYFINYDYILIDEAYNKIRLKGFCDENNKLYKKNNDIKNVDDYIKNYCAYKCRYLLLKKIK